MSIEIIILITWMHFLADFILQSDKVAVNKSSNNQILAKHVFIYSICMIPFGIWFALINGILHFITDYISSRLTSYYWKKEERHKFFVVIGADQAIHMTCLFTTFYFLQ